MNPEPYLLGYLSAAVVAIGAAVCINSRILYLQGAKMSRLEQAVTAVEGLVTGLRGEIQTLRDEDTGDLDQAGQNALADRLERLVSPVEENPPAAETPETPTEPEVPAPVEEPVTEETTEG